jgi:integrase
MSPRAPKKIPGIENRRRQRRDGSAYWTFRVRWVDPATGERRGEEFDDQADAVDFKAKLRLAKRSGRLAELDAGRETLAAFFAEWWEVHATVALARNTLKKYATFWNVHALPRLGHLELRQIDAHVVAVFRQALEKDGVGAPTIQGTMAMLQGVFRVAVQWRRVTANPFTDVRKPTVAKPAVTPLAPASIEAIAWHVPSQIDQVLVYLIAYAGLRPEEALALQWRHIRKGTILVEQKNIDGEIVVGQKTKRPPRTVDLLKPLAQDLAAYRLASGRPDDLALVVAHDGQPWQDHDYRNWRRRVFRLGARDAGLTNPGPWTKEDPYQGPRPYDLRHSFASLRIHEGELSIPDLASQMGHSPQMLLNTYSHVIAELKGQRKIKADAQIARARAALTKRTG